MGDTTTLCITAHTIPGMPKPKFPNVKTLLEKYLQQGIGKEDLHQALVAAVRADYSDQVELFLQYGATPTEPDNQFNISVLSTLAEKTQNPDLLRLLKEAGLKTDLSSPPRQTNP